MLDSEKRFYRECSGRIKKRRIERLIRRYIPAALVTLIITVISCYLIIVKQPHARTAMILLETWTVGMFGCLLSYGLIGSMLEYIQDMVSDEK